MCCPNIGYCDRQTGQTEGRGQCVDLTLVIVTDRQTDRGKGSMCCPNIGYCDRQTDRGKGSMCCPNIGYCDRQTDRQREGVNVLLS